MKKSRFTLFFVAWLIGGTTSYLLQGFFARLYPSPHQTLFFAFTACTLIGSLAYLGGTKLTSSLKGKLGFQDWPFFLTTIILARFVYKIIEISQPFLRENSFLNKPGVSPSYLITTLSAGLVLWIIIKPPQSEIHQKIFSPEKILDFLEGNWRGILVAGLFFIVYLVLALVFNRQDFNTNNIFFAADTHSWRLRLTHPNGYIFGTRVVHPFPFLILRPVVALFSNLFAGDWYYALITLLSLTGSANVFMAWIFIKNQVENQTYAYLFAALLGISTTYLLFNSIAETYIFSSFLLISFLVVLQRQPREMWGLTFTGVAVFGITVSNFVQTVLAMFVRGFDFKRTFKYVLSVLAVCFIVSFVNKLVYPESALFFFKPSEYAVESTYTINDISIDRLSRRFKLVSNEMFFFSVVAPRPIMSTTTVEDRGEFPKFNFMGGARLSSIVGFGKYAIWFWAGILVTAVVMFGRQLWQEKLSLPNQFALALLSCLGFNFLLHLFYGFEPFLYSANWTYALILFPAITLRPFAGSKILQAIFVLLIGLLMFNNQSFLYFLMNELIPYFLISR